MKEFVNWLFSENNSDLQIGLYDLWHFTYLFLILGGALFLALVLQRKSALVKQKTLRLFAYLVIGFYVADFFIMPLSDSYNGIGIDKLPFHICTLMGVMAAFVQFNTKFRTIKAPVVTLSLVSSLVWMVYPGSALGGQPPFCYIVFQTFVYHGLLFTWGFLNLSLGEVTLDIRKIWKEFVGILMIFVWAWFGNTVYDGNQNWFFINTSIVSFLSDESLPFVVIPGVFIVCLIIYGAYYAISAVMKRKTLTF